MLTHVSIGAARSATAVLLTCSFGGSGGFVLGWFICCFVVLHDTSFFATVPLYGFGFDANNCNYIHLCCSAACFSPVFQQRTGVVVDKPQPFIVWRERTDSRLQLSAYETHCPTAQDGPNALETCIALCLDAADGQLSEVCWGDSVEL